MNSGCNSLSNKEIQIWVTRERKTKAKRNSRLRQSLIQRKNENRKRKRRNKFPVTPFGSIRPETLEIDEIGIGIKI